ncbi:MAG: Na+/H+ antiporter NhaC family protein [Pseudomonadota bacterium]
MTPVPLGAGTAWSLLPALLAIGLALLTRQVVPSLLLGCLVAAVMLAGGHPIDGLASLADSWLVGALNDADHVKIVLFSLCIAGMVGVLSRAGATASLVGLVTRRARGPRSAAVAAWVGGLLLFFDDYANCLVLGHAFRPVADRVGMSRAKLAWIVDSTAAPIASLALVSTWIGYEVGLIGDGLAAAPAGQGLSGYGFFLQALPYRAYGILTIVLVGTVAATGRDWGPMRRVEANARALAAREPVPATPHGAGPAWIALLSLATLVLGTLGFMLLEGRAEVLAAGGTPSLGAVLDVADGFRAMAVVSLATLLLASGLALATRALRPAALVPAVEEGMGGLFPTLIVLILAWTLGAGLTALGAASYITGTVGAWLPPVLLPAAVFLVAAGCSFATGTSFGTMAILLPVVVPLAVTAGGGAAPVALAAVAAVLDGSCFGDHASPISDTTVLSASASGCPLVEHVRTQLPYALLAATLALLLGYLPAGFGVPAVISALVGALAVLGAVRVLGARPAPPRC